MAFQPWFGAMWVRLVVGLSFFCMSGVHDVCRFGQAIGVLLARKVLRQRRGSGWDGNPMVGGVG